MVLFSSSYEETEAQGSHARLAQSQWFSSPTTHVKSSTGQYIYACAHGYTTNRKFQETVLM